MPTVSTARLVVVRLCVEELWMARRDGRFAALEDALVDVLDSKILAGDRRAGERRNNVILLSDYLERRRLADRRKRKPP